MGRQNLAVLRMVVRQDVRIAGIEGLPVAAVNAIDRFGPVDLAGHQVETPAAQTRHLLGHLQQRHLLELLPLDLHLIIEFTGQARQMAQHGHLRRRRRVVGHSVHGRDGPDRAAGGIADRRAGEEPDPGLPGHPGMLAELGMFQRIGHHQGRVRPHGRKSGAHADMARQGPLTCTDFGSKYGLIVLEHRHQAEWHVQRRAGHRRQPIKRRRKGFRPQGDAAHETSGRTTGPTLLQKVPKLG